MNFVLVEARVGHITSWFFQTYTEAHRYMMNLLKQTLDTYYSDEEIPYWEEIILWEQYNGGFFGFFGDCAYANTGCYTYVLCPVQKEAVFGNDQSSVCGTPEYHFR